MKYIIFVFTVLVVNVVRAETATINVIDNNGQPVENAVVSFISEDRSLNHLEGNVNKPVMAQEGQEFIPYVLPVSLGSDVNFPNKDNFRHMIYSFSKAKRFEVQLYGGEDQISVTFDKAGAVVLGCNIHDNMVGYIYVVDTEHVVKTGHTGRGEINNLPVGAFKVSVWHPNLKGDPETYTKEISIEAEKSASIELILELKKIRTLRDR